MFCKTCEQDKTVDQMHSGVKCKDCYRIYIREYHRRWRQRTQSDHKTFHCTTCDIHKLGKDMAYPNLCVECAKEKQIYYRSRKRELENAESEP